ncbi:MAG: hypothetical protein IPK26_16465 [Planctomycetes bacterium]|nr:hypothetical protein [Planctomycetota bacterium]
MIDPFLSGPVRTLLPFSLALALGAMATAQTLPFDGLEQRCQLGGAPPSVPSGAALDTPTASIANNTSWIVQVCNSQIAAFPKYSGAALFRDNLSGDFVGSGSCSPTQTFFGPLGATRVVDNKVLCDRNTGRFCVIGMQQTTFLPGTPGLYVAFSDNSYPARCASSPGVGGWHMWRLPLPAGYATPGAYQPDFNGMGQTDTQIIWSGILQPLAGGQPRTWIRIIDKLPAGSFPSTLTYQDFVSPSPRPTDEFLHAADTFDPISQPILAAVLVPTGNTIRIVHANRATGQEDPVLLPVPQFLPPAGYVPSGSSAVPSGAPQSGGTQLDVIDGRMQSAVVRGGFLYCCHTVLANAGANAPHVVRWYQIALNGWPTSGTPTLVQSGDIAPGLSPGGNPIHAFMPSVAVNQDGAMFVVYSRSASDQVPGIGWSARRGISPLGTLPFTGTVSLTSPTAYTTSNGIPGNANVHRWGDWNSAVVDLAAPFTRFIACGPQGRYGPPLANLGFGTCSLLSFLPNHWATRIQSIHINDPQWAFDYGGGSPGTGGVTPDLTSVGPRPRVGQTSSVTVTNSAGAPTLGVGIVSLASTAPLGVPSPFGTLWVDSMQALLVNFALPGTDGSFPLAVAMSPAFIGTSLFLQAGVIDGGAAGGIALSDAMQVICGS